MSLLNLVCFGAFFLFLQTEGTEVKVQRFTNFGVQQKLLREIINPSYDRRIPPFEPNSTVSHTTIITSNMYVRSVEGIDDIGEVFNTQITFRLKWKDDRLAYANKPERHNFAYITTNTNADIWVPDIFFTNEKKGQVHDVITPNVYIRIYPDGHVLYSLRISLALKCPMNFRLYPFDTQNCSIRFASYGKTIDSLVLTWQAQDPVQVTKNVDFPLFKLLNFSTSYCNSQTETGVYSCLNASFIFKRRWNYYLVQVYIPCTMMVILAWLTFFFPRQGTGGLGRLLVATITLLTMANQVATFNRGLPKVSYTRSIDWWTGICLTFVFATIWEFTVLQFLDRDQKPAAETEESADGGSKPDQQRSSAQLCDKIDFVARFAYALLFVAFTVIYVIVYCVRPF